MKHCRKSNPEPPALSAFRAASPEADWDAARANPCYGEIRTATRSDQGGLCAYCEISLAQDNEQIAHFHPKSDKDGTCNWALKWENLWLACKGGTQRHLPTPDCFREPLHENRSCDERKGDTIVDGDVLAPSEVPLFPRIFCFKQRVDGIEIAPDEKGCEEAGISVDKVRNTIDVFNLNCARLAEARLVVHRELERALKKLRDNPRINPIAGVESLARHHLTRDANNHWPRFFTLRRWHLKMAAENHLIATAYQG